MSTIDDVVAAITAEDGTSWQVADAVAGLPETDDEGKLTLDRIAKTIHKRVGVEWKPLTLGRYRATSRAFPIDIRMSMHTFHAHMELRAHPDKLLEWKPKKPGDVLTVERARALRGRSAAAKPKPEAWRTELRRAFGAIERLAERDPAFVVDMLEQTVNNLRQTYRNRLSPGGNNGLRAV